MQGDVENDGVMCLASEQVFVPSIRSEAAVRVFPVL
jgi:hypothetical protein